MVRGEPAGWSVRQNTMPVPGGAGRSSIRTLRLLCTADAGTVNGPI